MTVDLDLSDRLQGLDTGPVLQEALGYGEVVGMPRVEDRGEQAIAEPDPDDDLVGADVNDTIAETEELGFS